MIRLTNLKRKAIVKYNSSVCIAFSSYNNCKCNSWSGSLLQPQILFFLGYHCNLVSNNSRCRNRHLALHTGIVTGVTVSSMFVGSMYESIISDEYVIDRGPLLGRTKSRLF
ncbi:MAG: hypothetical protein ACR5K2_03940 [Wolbachia sp.]